VKLYFLTLLSPRYQELGHEPRCIGFSETPFTPDRLTEADTEGGYYNRAVVEEYEPGLWTIGKVVAWYQFDHDQQVWHVIDVPPEHAKIAGWALG
jgi:hypothetical protein